jgi:hypothetical protein
LCLNVDIGKLFLDCQLRIQIQWYFIQIISSHPDDQFPYLGGYLWFLSELFWTAQMRVWGSGFQFALFFDVADFDFSAPLFSRWSCSEDPGSRCLSSWEVFKEILRYHESICCSLVGS